MIRSFIAGLVSLLLIANLSAKDDYKLGPESEVQEGVPQGKIEKFTWKSTEFAGTERDFWVYVPAQYDGKEPACVMVFQDGASYMNPKGAYRATVVMDNLIHKKEIPVMVGIFINPGVFPDKLVVDKKGKKVPQSNRSVEYDTLSPHYASFLENEILPEVAKKVKLRWDPAGRGIGGASSGGICAFTVAWERPDLFGKVLSHIGSFTNIRKGDQYPGMIRKKDKKPIRVFLQDGSNDLDNDAGNWWLGNLQMESALKYKKYDYKTVWGDGGHTGKHGGSILPDTMRWLWRDTPPEPKKKKLIDVRLLEETARTMHRVMSEGTGAEREDFLRSVLLKREELEVIIPKCQDAVWKRYEEVYAAAPTVASLYYARHALGGRFRAIDIREVDAKPRSCGYFSFVDLDVPLYTVCLDLQDEVVTTTWVQTQGRWVLVERSWGGEDPRFDR